MQYCEAERALLGDVQCLHRRALAVLCKLVVDEPLRQSGDIGSSRRVIMREVPSALPIVMALVRDAGSSEATLTHALYILRELLRDEDGGARNVRELLRLAPDAVSCFLLAFGRVGVKACAPLLDVLFAVLPSALASQEEADRVGRLAALNGVAGLLFSDGATERTVHLAAAVLVRAVCMSGETLYVQPVLAGLRKRLGSGAADLRVREYFSQTTCRVARELVERSDLGKRGHVGQDGRENCGPATGARWRELGQLFAKWRTHTCEHCGFPDANSSRTYMYCKRCRRSHFCGARHQRAAWSHGHHKTLCAALQGLAEADRERASHGSGDAGPPLETEEDVARYVLELAERAARAGVPGSAIVIVVQIPAPMQSDLARERAEVIPSVEHDLAAGRIRVTWETCLEYVGFHRDRVMSLEMDLVAFPSLLDREAAMNKELQWLERSRAKWWDLSQEADESERDSGDGGDSSSDQGGSDNAATSAGDDAEEAETDSDASENCRQCRNGVENVRDAALPTYHASSREYRVAWWEWTRAGHRSVRYSHCRLPNATPVPKLKTRHADEPVEELEDSPSATDAEDPATQPPVTSAVTPRQSMSVCDHVMETVD